MDKASTSLRLQEARASVSRSAGEDADGPPTKKPHLSVQSSTTHSLPSENGQLSRAPQTIPSAGTKKKTISDVIGNIGMTGNGGTEKFPYNSSRKSANFSNFQLAHAKLVITV
eukprot:m.266608 g.266608  ORF g.266608 m.266608 type:complete len:113 (+) comp40503_c0_seq17:319-657(+)